MKGMEKTMRTVNFGVIGGGSIFSPELVDLITKELERLGNVNIKFMDVDQKRQSVVGGLCERIVKKKKSVLPGTVDISYVDTYQKAIEGSDYILIQFRVGGEDARIEDELLGKKYCIPFVETVSVCGIATFLRTYTELEKVAKLINHFAPDAWVLNFANPAGVIAESLSKLGVKNVIGVCNASTRLLQFLKPKLGFDDNADFFMNWRGLNHLTVVDRFVVEGKEMMSVILDGMKDYETDRIPFPAEMCRRLGFLPNQYFQYYYLEREIIKKEQAAEKVRSEMVKEINASLLNQYETIDEVPDDLTKRGGSGYSKTVMEVILSLHTGNRKIHYIVTQNKGAIPELPYDSFVEIPCMVDKNSVMPIACEKLPDTAAPLICTMKAYEIKLIEAAMERNKNKLYNSMMIHPLLGSHDLVRPLMDEILEKNRIYLSEELVEAK